LQQVPCTVLVFLEDSGSFFELPLDKVWIQSQAHSVEHEKIHPDMKKVETERI
jgi:hypothetical protein